MEIAEKYMYRCLQIAEKGRGSVNPNPMVGAVIVHNNKIIGEGYHRKFGEPHAEVNAVNSVKEQSLLPESTMYVSLEPCAHFGKTPPCANLIVSKKIPKVVIAVLDPNPSVAGKGVQILRNAGVDVSIGLLQKEAEQLNRPFFVNQLYNRPYIVLKWAQSCDGFMDLHRTAESNIAPAQISNSLTMSIVHKFRTEMQGIMVGTNTALLDNPRLTARKWFGNNPVRITIDKDGKISADAAIFNNEAPTIVFTQLEDYPVKKPSVKPISIDFEEDVTAQIIDRLYHEKIYSVMIEGGAHLLSSFIDKNRWDDAYIEISSKSILSGVKAPEIQSISRVAKKYLDSVQFHLKNEISRNFL